MAQLQTVAHLKLGRVLAELAASTNRRCGKSGSAFRESLLP